MAVFILTQSLTHKPVKNTLQVSIDVELGMTEETHILAVPRMFACPTLHCVDSAVASGAVSLINLMHITTMLN